MNQIFDLVKETLSSAIKDNKVFMYEGKYLNALAFFHGMNKDPKVCAVKSVAKKRGLKYNYNFDCYIEPVDKEKYEAYRREKDQFLEQLVHWKLQQPTEQ
jgi:hypothetical protein